MATYSMAENLHRLIKETLDSGVAASIGEAEEMFRGFRLGFEISENDAHDRNHQAALLTGVALARRVFLGGVRVSCPGAVPLKLALPAGKTIGEAVVRLGGTLTENTGDDPLVTIGDEPRKRANRFNIRTVFEGWRGGIVPAHSKITMSGGATVPLAAMLSAALAVNESFAFVRTGSTIFGRRPVGLSLWRSSPAVDWLEKGSDEPTLRYLPARLWLIGLGHLGQAFLWALGLLDYPTPSGLSLVLQDVDVITPASVSTSVLTDSRLVGRKKTRAVADWCEARGFDTRIVERRFSADFGRQPEEPSIALCGVDNALARQALDQVGFDFIVEAGLGRGYRNYRSMRLHTLPGPRSATAIWKSEDDVDDVQSRPAYEKLLNDGDLDRCGITLLAGKAVGAPFVGAVAACLAIAEVLRLLHGGTVHELIDLDLQAVEHRSVVPHNFDFSSLNPGYVLANIA
jgi:hypothetical protein